MDSSTVNPSLLIAVYDPTLGLQEAFETGYTRMNLIDANSIVAINVGLQIRQGLDGNSAYDYTLSLSSSPVLDLVCDTSSATTYQYPCHVSLFVQIPNFDRTIISSTMAMGWQVSSKLQLFIKYTLTDPRMSQPQQEHTSPSYKLSAGSYLRRCLCPNLGLFCQPPETTAS